MQAVQVCRQPRVVVCDDFCTPAECDRATLEGSSHPEFAFHALQYEAGTAIRFQRI